MSRKKIMVVDDERFMLDILGFHLEENGFEVSVHDNADDALERITAGDIELVMTDWMMPGRNGREFIEALRQADPGADTPVIVVTAKDLTLEEREFLLASNCFHSGKPIDPAGLLDKVGEALS